MKLPIFNQFIQKVFGYLFFDICIKLMPFLILPFFAQTLTVTEFKTVSLYILLISFFLTLLPLGVSTKVLITLTDNNAKKLNIPSALLPSFIAAFTVSLLNFIYGDGFFLSKEEIFYLIVIGFNLSIGQVMAVRFQADQKSIFYGVIMLSLQACFYVPLIIYFFIYGNHVNEMFFIICILTQVSLLLFFYILERKAVVSRFRMSFKDTRLYAVFISSIIIHILVNSIRFVYDRYFMASKADDSSFVYYNVAIQVAMILSVLCVSGNRFWASFYFSNKAKVTKKHYFICVSILLLLTIVVYFIGLIYITYFYPVGYSESLKIMPVLLISFFMQGLYLIFSARLYILKYYKLINLSSLISLTLSILTMDVLFKEFGSYGVALSLSLSWLSLLFFSQFFSFYLIKKESPSGVL
ncbi:hypothetical protein KZZ04_16180 [Pseudoalteromonas sp. CR1]|uniref:lipopolysaccharide biosynthesis protein n=1 Tax=Pseudoalteromonas sp. CR1 TaxID=2861964 RepID=UPI001C605B91|nr:hypothetical protein [Pseudoalteromonas sp. CR1]MBW4967895.1 hypothetical protein [Pseudoalteromonas sp. CR1]